ncbi:kinase-like domain-containing protein [Blakeslea trispora]|nr:kinase-like domain-containing protein [Blakeslea trispora]
MTHEIQQVVKLFPIQFDLQWLPQLNQPSQTLTWHILELYNKYQVLFEQTHVEFDYYRVKENNGLGSKKKKKSNIVITQHWIVPWNHALCLENILTLIQNDPVQTICLFHVKSQMVLQGICLYGLENDIRWYPWQWFSNLKLVGTSGFSTVYSAIIHLPYDVIVIQSRLPLPLNLHGITVCETTGDPVMVSSLATEGNLLQHIQSINSLPMIMHIVTRLAIHLASLHDNVGMCHRNIHPDNVIELDDDYFFIDYRFSAAITEASEKTKLFQVHYGRVPYIAPEIQDGIYTEKSDVFSLGILMWQLISGISFPSLDIILKASELYQIERIPGVCDEYQALVLACLEPLPEHRPTSEEVASVARKMAMLLDSISLVDCHAWHTYVHRRQKKCQEHERQYNQPLTISHMYSLSDIKNPIPLLMKNLTFQHCSFDPVGLTVRLESNFVV